MTVTPIFCQKVFLTAAEVQSMNSDPPEIVVSPGAGRLLQLEEAFLSFTAGSETLSPGGNLQIFVNPIAQVQASTSLDDSFLTGGNSYGSIRAAAGTFDDTDDLLDQPMILFNGSADFSGNTSLDCTLEVTVLYRIIAP